MKAIYLGMMAMAVQLLAGCSQNEIMEISPNANVPIGFGVYTGVQTKGTENTITEVGTAGFGVLGYYTQTASWPASGSANSYTPNYMYNEKVTRSGSNWTYGVQKYWPNGDNEKISFFAYAPYSATGGSNGITLPTSSATGDPTLNFTLQAPTAQVDLLTAEVKNQAKTTSDISFAFGHVLARARFTAKVDEVLEAASHVFITGAQIAGSSANSTSKYYTKAKYTYNKTTATAWSYTAGDVTIPTANQNLSTLLDLKTPTGMGGYTTPSIDLTGTTAVGLFKKTNTKQEYLFFIPVANTTGTATNDVKVVIDYDIVTIDPKLSTGHSKASNTVTVALPAATLKAGAAYDFLFTVGVEKITVSSTVTAWPTETSTPVPVN